MRLPGPFPLFVSLLFLLGSAVSVSAVTTPARPVAAPPAPPVAADARSDDFRLSLFVAEQIDRFNPGVAASTNSIASGGEVPGVDFDWHVADLPLKKKSSSNPRVYIEGRMLTCTRVLAQQVKTAYDSTTKSYPDSLQIFPDAKSVELNSALKFAYPMGVVNGEAQTAMYFRMEGGAIFAEHATGGLLSYSRFGLGFQRLVGTFSGSYAEVCKGSDATFGSLHGSGRYVVHVLLQGNLAPPEGSRRTRSNLGAFADLEVNTDNAGGPDGVRALLGLKLEGNGLFDGLRALIGM